MNRRPSPELVAARKREIARRYATKSKVGKRTRSMAAIRLSELTRWLEAVHGAGEIEQTEQTEHAELIARIFVHHLIGLPHGDRRASDWMAARCPWISVRSREAMITEAGHCPIKWKARTLGWKLKLTAELRASLKITTIAPIDMTDADMIAARKARQAASQRALRASRRQARVTSI
jgi:hypothetical protein